MNTNLAPIVLFVYNRPRHTRQTLEALSKNEKADQSVLYVFSDGSKNDSTHEELQKINEVRNIVKEKKWCKEVHLIEREINVGLADNIVEGITTIINEFGKVIVMEDDLLTSQGFLNYMNDALVLYETRDEVMHISGYMFPVKEKLPETFFYNATSCWGWGTWKRAWDRYSPDLASLSEKLIHSGRMKEFNIENSNNFYAQIKANLDGTIKTWGIKWHTVVFLDKGLCLHPHHSLVNNVGHDESGENCGVSDKYSWDSLAVKVHVKPIALKESALVRKAMKEFYNGSKRLPSPVNSTKNILLKIIQDTILIKLRERKLNKKYRTIQLKYKKFSMIPENVYVGNLILCEKYKNVPGCIVECGVWRGGMIAGIAELLGKSRNYFLFDSFEGLPEAKEIDGVAALKWQNNKTSPGYFNNCAAEMNLAENAMKMSGAIKYKLIKGWFSESLPAFTFNDKIAILRLDGDWYNSTMDCLTHLYEKVNIGGIIIIDDYYTWDGCSKAVHDFISRNDLTARIRQSEAGICYIIKQ